MSIRKPFKLLSWSLLVVVLLFGLFLLKNLLTGNVHTVIAGTAYRSAILDKVSLSQVIKQHHIKSLLNLTGAHAEKNWYREELAVSVQTGITHANLSLPAHGLISRQRLQSLVALLQHLPQPILVHCRQGADRTGLAAAILVILHGNYQTGDWRHQVSWRYNLLSPSSIGYVLMQNYLHWLNQKRLVDTRQSFLAWVDAGTSLRSYRGWFFN